MKRAAVDHPKLQRLQRALGFSRFMAMGVLEALWHFSARYSPRGDIGRWSDQEIADWIGWEEEPGKLIEALVGARWLDPHSEYRLVVHDWQDHADEACKLALKRNKLEFVGVVSPQIETEAEPVATCRDKSLPPEPEPVPEPEPEPGTDSAAALGVPPTNGTPPKRKAPTTEQRVAMAAGVCVEHYRHEFQRLHPGLSPPLVDNAGKNVLRTKLRAICGADHLEIGAAEDECKRLLTRFLSDDHPKVSESMWDLRAFSWRANALRGEGASNGGAGSRREQDNAEAERRTERYERLNRESVQRRWGDPGATGAPVPGLRKPDG